MPTMKTKRPACVQEHHLEYLDALRARGEANMWGAGSFLMKAFRVTRADAQTILIYWVQTYPDRHPL